MGASSVWPESLQLGSTFTRSHSAKKLDTMIAAGALRKTNGTLKLLSPSRTRIHTSHIERKDDAPRPHKEPDARRHLPT
jgi:hypothetical protein